MPRDLLCFSHLRWDFVYQRPNHLMARAARDRRVFFIEEPVFDDLDSMTFDPVDRDGVRVVTPRLPRWTADDPQPHLKRMIDRLVWQFGVHDPVLWYYTPMALPWTDHLARSATVFDCMDHLAGFKGAPPGLLALEGDLMRRADLVLTGGAQLYKAKRATHPNVHCFPSSVDVVHFAAARGDLAEPADQASIVHPRLGYCGVIDERMDLGIVAAAAAEHPEWQFVMLGPVVKIDPDTLPRAANIHYLGLKTYDELPAYLAGWDAAVMPFAHNEATRYISPTKTPEYLAAGLPVASTSIHDVVEPYERLGLVDIGDGPAGFGDACERALAADRPTLIADADRLLAQMSWNATWKEIDVLVTAAVESRAAADADDQPTATVPPPAHALVGAPGAVGMTPSTRSLAALE